MSASGCSGGYSAGAESSVSLDHSVSFFQIPVHCKGGYIPFDSKSSDPWLLGQDMPLHPLDHRLVRRLVVQLWGIVFIIDVIANADKFPVVIAAGKEDDSDA